MSMSSHALAQPPAPDDRLLTIDVDRRMYGRRYSALPVDERERTLVRIACDGTYMRPEMYDIQPGDTIRWQHNGRYVQATVGAVTCTANELHATLRDAHLLPPDYFPY